MCRWDWPKLLIRRFGQMVRWHPSPSGPSVRLREMVRVVPLGPAGVAVSPAHDCFFPKHVRWSSIARASAPRLPGLSSGGCRSAPGYSVRYSHLTRP